MKKFSFAIVATFIFLPVLAYASWWNPLTWFTKEHVPVTQNVVENKKEEEIGFESEVKASTTPTKQLATCFGVMSLYSKATDISKWETFEAPGFAFKYPVDQVKIELAEKTGNSDGTYKITDVKNNYVAFVKMHKLKEVSYRARYMHSPSIVYEFRSNTWWKDQYVWDPSTLEECSPNESAKTNDNKYPIYVTGDGDVGAFYTNYFIVLRDVIKTDNYEPLVIEFRISADGNDPNFNFFKPFNDILEIMIKTVELRPTSRG